MKSFFFNLLAVKSKLLPKILRIFERNMRWERRTHSSGRTFGPSLRHLSVISILLSIKLFSAVYRIESIESLFYQKVFSFLMKPMTDSSFVTSVRSLCLDLWGTEWLIVFSEQMMIWTIPTPCVRPVFRPFGVSDKLSLDWVHAYYPIISNILLYYISSYFW